MRNGTKVKDVDSPILSLFFEDESGSPVSDEVKDQVRGDLTAYWLDMVKEGETPCHYKGLGFKRREHYRKTMEEKYPWLRLCEGHWKVKQIWINYWKKSRVPAANDKCHTPIEISSNTEDSTPVPVPIEVSSDEDGAASTGSKRGRSAENSLDSDISSKRHKGKGKDVGATPAFHPPKPQPKKKIAPKIGRVSRCHLY
jgi:hypothetical protein